MIKVLKSYRLNTIYIFELNKWIRLDARGNKEGINAQFSIEEEQLAFPIRTYYDKKDYPLREYFIENGIAFNLWVECFLL